MSRRIALLALLTPLSCTEPASAPAPGSASEAPTAKAPEAPAAEASPESEPAIIELSDASGGIVARAVRTRQDHWRIEDAAGEKIGKISVESDRVKVKDVAGELRAKIKLRDRGLKLEDGQGRALLKVKLRGPETFDVEDDDGSRLGRIEGGAGELEGTRIEAVASEGGLLVRRGGEPLLRTRGPVAAGAAAVAASPRLDPFARVGLLVFLYAVRPG